MNSLFNEKLKRPYLVGDGGMGTLLQAAGLPAGACGELWNVDEPGKLVEIHQTYVESGADLLTTNTFGGCAHKLRAYGLDGRVEEINAAAARNARRAAEGSGAAVLGDIGPSGAMLEPYGDVKPGDLRADFGRQVKGLLDGGVDAFIIETMMDFGEVTCAVEAIRLNSGLPIIASLFFSPDKQEEGQFRTMFGDTPASIVEKAVPLAIDVIGSNCGMTIGNFVKLAARFQEATDMPVMLQPNAGGSRPGADGAVIYEDTPQQMASQVDSLFGAGARIVGGCCGTDPEYIRLVRRIANERIESARS